ncbi:MAG: sialidase family protein, partial [Bacteroidales bacterium]
MNADLFSGRMLRTLSVFIIISGFCLISFQTFNQNSKWTNPFLQQRGWNQKPIPLACNQITSSVITINNWDNFNLGIDFATTSIAANPAMPAWYFTAFSTNEGHQTDNGIDWESEVPDFGSTMKGDPVVAYDSLGNLFYGNMFGTNSVQGLEVIKSKDNGATWSPAVTALTGTNKCWMACDQTNGPNANNIYTCMTNNVAGNFSRSIDHGKTFTSTFTTNTQNIIPGMMVCVGPLNNKQGGSVYVVTNSGTQFASIFTFYRSINGGLTFTKMSDVQFSNYVGTGVEGWNSVSGMRTNAYPLIAADNSYGPHRGRLYLVYASNDPPGNGNMPDIFCHFSDNGGINWSSAKKVNDDDSTQNNSQWHPAIWCDKDNGRLYIQWMDTRDTPTHDSAFIYATYSDDGGLTFAANQKISNQKMVVDCITCNGGGNPIYEGDYNGIYSNRKVAMLSWTDFRYGTFMSTTGYFPDFAMAIDHTIDTLYTDLDSTIFNISIPEVKLYTDTVLLSDTVSPVPDSGAIIVSFPSGNIITNYPNSLPAKIVLTGAVAPGYYQIKFVAESPNGTPVHQRTATIFVRSGDSVYVVATATPDSICAGE